jgi:hypothetical protein
MLICVLVLSSNATNFTSSARSSSADSISAKSLTNRGGVLFSGKGCAPPTVAMQYNKHIDKKVLAQ